MQPTTYLAACATVLAAFASAGPQGLPLSSNNIVSIRTRHANIQELPQGEVLCIAKCNVDPVGRHKELSCTHRIKCFDYDKAEDKYLNVWDDVREMREQIEDEYQKCTNPKTYKPRGNQTDPCYYQKWAMKKAYGAQKDFKAIAKFANMTSVDWHPGQEWADDRP